MTNLYSVTYNTNNSTGGTTPATQTAESDATTYTFTAPTAEQHGLVKTGYTLMGWADSPTAVFQQYAPGATITLSNSDSSKTLYAIWGKEYTYKYSAGEGGGSLPANGTIMLGNLPYTMTPTGSYANIYRVGYLATGWNSITFATDNQSPTTTPTWVASNSSNFNTMQDISTAGYCNALTESGKQLFDIRDGKKYWVAKLKDGNCWMTQNLDLNITANGLSAVDTDITSDWNSSSTYKPMATQTNMTSPSNFSSGNDLVASYDPGNKYCNNGTCNSNPANGNSTSTNNGHDAYGNYYTYVAATAGTGGGKTSGSASGSICPKGWQLPTSNSTTVNKSFGKLLNGLTGATLVSNSGPYYYVYGGYVTGGSLSTAGSYGYYWSSTAYNATVAYYLYFDSSSVGPSYSNDRYFGYSVRCVAR